MIPEGYERDNDVFICFNGELIGKAKSLKVEYINDEYTAVEEKDAEEHIKKYIMRLKNEEQAH